MQRADGKRFRLSLLSCQALGGNNVERDIDDVEQAP